MNSIEQLVTDIASLKESISSQEETYRLACELLAHREAAIGLTRRLAKSQGKPLTPEQINFYKQDVVDAYDNVTAVMIALGNMRRELRQLESQLP